jgi:hypothetical protein
MKFIVFLYISNVEFYRSKFKLSITPSSSNGRMSSSGMTKRCNPDASCNSSSSSNSRLSVSGLNSSSKSNSFDSEKLKFLLKYEKDKYQIIKNESSSAAGWWRAFGYPAQLDENNKLNRIIGFITSQASKKRSMTGDMSGPKTSVYSSCLVQNIFCRSQDQSTSHEASYLHVLTSQILL